RQWQVADRSESAGWQGHAIRPEDATRPDRQKLLCSRSFREGEAAAATRKGPGQERATTVIDARNGRIGKDLVGLFSNAPRAHGPTPSCFAGSPGAGVMPGSRRRSRPLSRGTGRWNVAPAGGFVSGRRRGRRSIARRELRRNEVTHSRQSLILFVA